MAQSKTLLTSLQAIWVAGLLMMAVGATGQDTLTCDTILDFPDEMASYADGGETGFYQYLGREIQFRPNQECNYQMVQRLYLEFVVNCHGDVEDVRLMKKVDQCVEDWVISQVAPTIMQTKWTPARHSGRPISQRWRFPLHIHLK